MENYKLYRCNIKGRQKLYIKTCWVRLGLNTCFPKMSKKKLCLTLTTQRSTIESSHSMYASIGDCSSNRRSNSWYTVTGENVRLHFYYLKTSKQENQMHKASYATTSPYLRPLIPSGVIQRSEAAVNWRCSAGCFRGEWTCLTFWSPSLVLWLCWSWEWLSLGVLFVWQ